MSNTHTGNPTVSMAEFRKTVFGEPSESSHVTHIILNDDSFVVTATDDFADAVCIHAVTTFRLIFTLPSSWEIGTRGDVRTYGYLLKEPMTKEQLDMLVARSGGISVLAPSIVWEGTSAPIYEWHPDRRYSFEELMSA